MPELLKELDPAKDVVEITVRLITPNVEGSGEKEHNKQKFIYMAPKKDLKTFIDKIKSHVMADNVKTVIEGD